MAVTDTVPIQHREVTATEPTQCRAVTRRQYPRNKGVFRGIDLRTVAGRRIRSLYAPYLEQAELDEGDLTHQAAALKVAKLTVIVERLQAEALKSKKYSKRLGSEIVRLENLLRRAKLELIALKPRELTWWEQRQLEKDENDGEES
jgi:hypothetical protein